MGRIIYITFFIFLMLLHSPPSLAENFEWTSIGIRGAVNFKDAGLPPGEKVAFEQFDVVGTVGFPGSWDVLWG